MNDLIFNHSRIHQSTVIPVGELIFDESVRNACEANYCGRFGKSWTCPPNVGSVEKIKQRLFEFENAYIFTVVGELEDSFDIEGMDSARIESKSVLKEAMNWYENKGLKILPLSCGSCEVCSECTCPNEPCRFPDKAIISVEACGINVVELSAKIKLNYHNGNNTVTYFNIILF